MGIKIEIPSQKMTFFCYGVVGLVLATSSCIFKPKIQKMIKENCDGEKEQEKETTAKVITYASIGAIGAIIGGVAKGIRTRTCEGMIVGIIAGTAATLSGALLRDITPDIKAIASRFF